MSGPIAKKLNASTNDPSEEKRIFFAALDFESAPERTAYLEMVCAGNPALRRNLDRLLANHFEDDSFLNEPPLSGVGARPSGFAMEEPGDCIGPYKLLEKLGEGGFGVVYVAEQKEPVRRRVALKVVKTGMDTRQVVARFEAERQALAMMDHPSIAKVFEAGCTEAGRPYFIMELVRGVRITEYCQENEMSVPERLKIFTMVCLAIQHAHQKGIIHRDIKPSNILVTLHDGVAVPKVIDFGIAKAVEGNLTEKTVYTQFQQFIGTPAYMSPEQAEMSGADVDTRTDIYALGVLLYELLTGHTPFDGKELFESGLENMRRTIREREPIRPSTRLRRQRGGSLEQSPSLRAAPLAADLDWIVLKCLEKDRTRRYATANDLAADIGRHLKNEVVSAVAPTKAYRLKKFYQRNKASVAIACFFGALIIVGVTSAVALTIRARKAERIAERNLYGGSMQMIQHAWERGNIRRVRDLLEETSGDPERGFEWFYWQNQLHSGRELRGHDGPVFSVAFSKDGSKVVTCASDLTVRVWDTHAARELMVIKADTRTVANASYSRDGQRILTSHDGVIKIWDAQTGNQLFKAEKYGAALFSPNATKILAAATDRPAAAILESTTGREVITLQGHSAGLSGSAWSLDGRRAATCSYDSTVRVWDAATGEELFKVIGIYCRSVALSPDGETVAATDNAGAAILWKVSTQQPIVQFKIPPTITCPISFSPDGRLIACLATDYMVTIRDAATGLELFTIKNPSPVRSLAFSDAGPVLAVGDEDGVARMWDISNNGALLNGRTIKLNGGIYGVAFSPDGATVATAGADWMTRLWDAESGAPVAVYSAGGPEISSVAYSPAGDRVILAGADGTARILDAKTGRTLLIFRGHRSPVFAALPVSDGIRVVSRSNDGVVKVWEVKTGRELLTLSGHAVAISPEGRRIATAISTKNETKIYDSVTGTELLRLKGSGSLAFSPDGGRIISGGNASIGDFSPTVWHAGTGRKLLKLRGHTGAIHSVEFSGDGKRILTASADQTARIWDAQTGKELLLLQGHSFVLSEATFSPDAQRIATASHDGSLIIWNGASRPLAARSKISSFTAPAAGFALEWDGEEGHYFSAKVPDNDALATKGTVAFGSSELDHGGLHTIRHINDGLYGNDFSWISRAGLGTDTDPNPWIGVIFPKMTEIQSIAWSRDNGNESAKQFTDRCVGVYILQFTRVPRPSAKTAETGDASTGWQTVGALDYTAQRRVERDFYPWSRHRYMIAEKGRPLVATAIRILVSDGALCLDELEVNPPTKR